MELLAALLPNQDVRFIAAMTFSALTTVFALTPKKLSQGIGWPAKTVLWLAGAWMVWTTFHLKDAALETARFSTIALDFGVSFLVAFALLVLPHFMIEKFTVRCWIFISGTSLAFTIAFAPFRQAVSSPSALILTEWLAWGVTGVTLLIWFVGYLLHDESKEGKTKHAA